MDAIKHLLDEHALIMSQLAELRGTVADLAARGEAGLPDALPVLARAGDLLGTRLESHARKEENALFPAMERVIGEQGPTAVMRMEHEDIHGQGRLLRDTLRELNEVEHPLIDATREQLRQSLAGGGSAATLRGIAEQILQIIDMHFYKEEQILYPMAQQLLAPGVLEEVGAAIAAMDEAEAAARRCLDADR